MQPSCCLIDMPRSNSHTADLVPLLGEGWMCVRALWKIKYVEYVELECVSQAFSLVLRVCAVLCLSLKIVDFEPSIHNLELKWKEFQFISVGVSYRNCRTISKSQ